MALAELKYSREASSPIPVVVWKVVVEIPGSQVRQTWLQSCVVLN